MYGELFALGSVFCFVISNVVFRKVEEIVSPTQINAIRTIIGTITYIIIAAIIGKFLIIFSFTPWLWFMLCLSFLFAQVFGDTAYFKAQEMLGTTLALSIAMIFPIFTTILSIIILHTNIPYYFYISMVLIIGGVLAIGFGKNNTKYIT